MEKVRSAGTWTLLVILLRLFGTLETHSRHRFRFSVFGSKIKLASNSQFLLQRPGSVYC